MDINEVFSLLFQGLHDDIGTIEQIISILLMTFVVSFYEFFVYRLVSKKTYYNKSMHVSLMVIPFLIAAIVSALQSNLVITLGTIGALAIIRYRSAVKDPIDMAYILWSVFIGISCGCQLYKLCVLTSIMVTIVLLLIEMLGGKLISNPYILIINSKKESKNEIMDIINKYSKNIKLKSRNITSNGYDYVYELSTKQSDELLKEIESLKDVKQFSLLKFDNDDAI